MTPSMNRGVTRFVFFATSLLILLTMAGLGEALGQPPANEIPADADPIEFRLIPPDLIIRHGHDIDLTEEQRAEIISVVKALQPDMMGAELEHVAAEGDLIAALDEHPIDEEGAEAAAQRAMTAENQVRTAHLSLLIRIRNLLTPEQQSRLQELRGY